VASCAVRRLALLVLLGAAAGCGEQGDCTLMSISAFGAALDLPGGTLPPDLVVRLYAPPGALRFEEHAADIAAGKSEPCRLNPLPGNGQGGAMPAEAVECAWNNGPGDPPWHGALEATASGYHPVHVELVAESDGCHPVTAMTEVSLQSL